MVPGGHHLLRAKLQGGQAIGQQEELSDPRRVGTSSNWPARGGPRVANQRATAS